MYLQQFKSYNFLKNPKLIVDMEYLRSAVKRITGKRPPPDEDRIRTPTVQAVVTQSSSDIEVRI